MIKKISHVGIATHSIAVLSEFYKALGLEVESTEIVEDQKVPSLHVADHVHHLGLVRGHPSLVDDGEFRVQTLGDRSRPRQTARRAIRDMPRARRRSSQSSVGQRPA